MRIKATAVGNAHEAFVERNYNGSLNIISSDDNNKGKTIAIQSMMYALGNEPTFPATFEYKDYYHYVEFEVNGITYYLCRRNNSFILKYKEGLLVFDSISEFKRYWSKHIFTLPQIIKNQIARIVDPVLFLQLFFVGQDKKDTSNISHSGLYNKQDFLNMLFTICNAAGIEMDEDELKKAKDELQNLKEERRVLLKQHKILTSHHIPVSYLSATNDRAAFSEKISALEKINSKITELRKARNVAATRKAKWETTLKELRSLNRTIDSGELRCMDCHSTNISYASGKKNGYSFDVSSSEMRNEIIASIHEKMEAYQEEIENYTMQISSTQRELTSLLAEDEITLESLVIYKEDVFSASEAELRIQEIDQRISLINSKLQELSTATESKKNLQNQILNDIIAEMNSTYRSIDPNGNLYFESLFTKKDETYSGSESTVFHLVKLYALRKVLNHNYPIVVDSFRAEDLSTSKEAVVIDLYSKIPNQVIFTTTLKAEEMGKYDQNTIINHIDYKNHAASKMLTSEYVSEFQSIMSIFSITL